MSLKLTPISKKNNAATLFRYALCACFLFCASLANAQQENLKAGLLNYKLKTDSTQKKYPAEKLYLQLNKPDYAVGDTIWLKAYLFNAPSLALSAKSGVFYVSLSNDSSTFTKQYRLPVLHGLGWGNISLANIPAGNYTLRAYTTWMRNFGQECFFTRQIKIAGEKISIDNQPVGNLNTVVLKRRLLREQSKQLKQEQAIDLQFLPEGGSLIAGMPAVIGFKAIGENGKGVNITGVIVDDQDNEVTSFASLHNGLGSFAIALKPGRKYSAKVNLAGGLVRKYDLPAIKTSGTLLNVVNDAGSDSVVVSVSATSDIMQNGESYYLIGRSRNVICYAAVLNFNNKKGLKRNVAKSLFPSGIAHFVLMTAKNNPLNERLVFINHNDNLHIETFTNRVFYNPHDSVAATLKVTDASGKSTTGNFSVTVTDDSQVSIDSLQDNIISHILLSADIKGYLEQPAYYLQNNNEARQALDDLLLTQGWVSYDFPSGNAMPIYAAENAFAVKGRVVNGFQSPFKGVKVILLSKSPLLLQDTLSDDAGRFSFANLPRIDTPAFIVKAVNRHGNSFNVGIVMDDEKQPVFSPVYKAIDIDTVADTALLATAKNNRIRKDREFLSPDGQMLKEVKIKAQKTVKGSQNLNGAGNADLVLDEADIEKEGKKSWLDIFYEKIKGFREGTFSINGNSLFAEKALSLWFFLHDGPALPASIKLTRSFSGSWFYINDKPIKVIVDGISVGAINYNLGYTDLTNYLKLHDAEDIKGIEVNSSAKYAQKYINPGSSISPSEVAFIEITTRSGNGPVIRNTPGIYLYKPLPLSWPKQFYKPLYWVTDMLKHQPDTRSAISWEPNIATDETGKAKFWFYTADKPATYTIITEGTDGDGNLGYTTSKLTVQKK